MTSTQNDESLLKADIRGRVQVSRKRREALLDEYEKSGLSGARFARLAGICYSTFAAWRQKRRNTRVGKNEMKGVTPPPFLESQVIEAPIQLLEASVESPGSAGANRLAMPAGLTVELPGGARLQVESPIQLRLAAELIALTNQTLRRPC
jgi:hypothetical protein